MYFRLDDYRLMNFCHNLAERQDRLHFGSQPIAVCCISIMTSHNLCDVMIGKMVPGANFTIKNVVLSKVVCMEMKK